MSGVQAVLAGVAGAVPFTGDATLVAGQGTTNVTGYSEANSYGSFTPSTIDGNAITGLETYYPTAGSKELIFLKSPGLNDNFLSMRIVGPGYDKTYTREQFTMYPNFKDYYGMEGSAADISKLVVGTSYEVSMEFSPVRTIVCGLDGAGAVGFQKNIIGSISYAPYRTTEVTGCYVDNIGFAFLLAGTYAKAYIGSVFAIVGGTEYYFAVNQASSYGQSGGNTYWYWPAQFSLSNGQQFDLRFTGS